ncbi:PGG domain [Dillenia turbinata]|uniref:PGG domain n=1 Tax=Dillenia turbinata TaxID=194707 RepID=A0AAN8Z5G7_9MAGN
MAPILVDPPKDPSKNWYEYYRFQLKPDSPNDARNALLVVAALIAAATFQAGINPPGGVWQDNSAENDHVAGKSVLASSKASSYAVFMFCNTLAFSASLNMITYLVFGCPFYTEVLIATYAMMGTYGAAIGAVGPKGSVKLVYLIVAFMLPYLLRLGQQLLI